MSKSLNKVMLIGHVGKDAEVRYTGNGKAVASFSLATSDSWKDKATGQQQERTEWHNVVAWDRLGEICGEYVKKGKKLYVEGRIQTDSFDDKEGVKKYYTKIIMNEMMFLDSAGGTGSGSGGGDFRASEGGSRSSGNSGGSSGYRAPSSAPSPMVNDFEPAGGGSDDDLPF